MCVFAILLSLFVVFTQTLSKLGLVALLASIHRSTNDDTTFTTFTTTSTTNTTIPAPNPTSIDYESPVFFLMYLTILLPPCYGLVHTFFGWCYSTKESRYYPTLEAVGYISLQALMQSVGISLFVFVAAPLLPSSLMVVCMTAVNVIPSFDTSFDTIKTFQIMRYPNLTQSGFGLGMASVGHVLVLIAIPIFIYFTNSDIKNDTLLAALFVTPISILLVSASWLPSLQYKMKTGSQPPVKNDDSTGPGFTDTSSVFGGLLSAMMQIVFSTVSVVIIMRINNRYPDNSGNELHYGSLNLSMLDPAFRQFMYFFGPAFFSHWAIRLACHMGLQCACFAAPMLLVTPLSIFLIQLNNFPSFWNMYFVDWSDERAGFTDSITYLVFYSIALIGWISQILSTSATLFQDDPNLFMSASDNFFFYPWFTGIFLEQSCILARKPPPIRRSDEPPIKNGQALASEKYKKSKIYVCSTMYREEKKEMKQLLGSLFRLDHAMKDIFECHVWMDGAIDGRIVSKYCVQLISCISEEVAQYLAHPTADSTVKVGDNFVKTGKRIETPYGGRLEFEMPTNGTPLIIHMKDGKLVKNKKRWSQIMYMYYFLQFRLSQKDDQAKLDTKDAYILCTDADVCFRAHDVQQLLSVLCRDDSIGAVCARTYCLGSGPIVWYQMFDYAVGHWFQKTAEHVLGTVMCCPGCFSLYRIEALRDTLIEYGSHVTEAVEFLTKDMGEDRWLCTLMVLAGWRLEYTAAAENETFCPDEFTEFFEQRRRWVPSTLANIIELLKKSAVAIEKNASVSLVFIIYQALMLFSTCLSPATVMLVIMGGIHQADPGIAMGWIQAFMIGSVLSYLLICLYAPKDFQLSCAKVLTICYAMIMAMTTIGVLAAMAAPIVSIPNITISTTVPTVTTFIPPPPTSAPNYTTTTMSPASSSDSSECYIVGDFSLSTIYLMAMTFFFLSAGFMHPKEFFTLAHGFWYLLCLPGGYLFMTIYSFCNLNSMAWGTREEAAAKSATASSWWDSVLDGMGRNYVRAALLDPKTGKTIMLPESGWSFLGRILTCYRSRSAVAKIETPHPYENIASSKTADKIISWKISATGIVSCSQLTDLFNFVKENENGDAKDDALQTQLTNLSRFALLACPELTTNGTFWSTNWDQQKNQYRMNASGKQTGSAEFWKKIRVEIENFNLSNIEKDSASRVTEHYPAEHVKSIEDFLKETLITDDSFGGSFTSTDVNFLVTTFKEHGYDNTTFLAGLKDSDMNDMNLHLRLNGRALKSRLLSKISSCIAELPTNIPPTLIEWLDHLCLGCYIANFNRCGYYNCDLMLLEGLTKQDLTSMGIVKIAHEKKLLKAIETLTKLISDGRKPEGPTEDDILEKDTRTLLLDMKVGVLTDSMLFEKNVMEDEDSFWRQMKVRESTRGVRGLGV